jgi:hypothetical protein
MYCCERQDIGTGTHSPKSQAVYRGDILLLYNFQKLVIPQLVLQVQQSFVSLGEAAKIDDEYINGGFENFNVRYFFV